MVPLNINSFGAVIIYYAQPMSVLSFKFYLSCPTLTASYLAQGGFVSVIHYLKNKPRWFSRC